MPAHPAGVLDPQDRHWRPQIGVDPGQKFQMVAVRMGYGGVIEEQRDFVDQHPDYISDPDNNREGRQVLQRERKSFVRRLRVDKQDQKLRARDAEVVELHNELAEGNPDIEPMISISDRNNALRGAEWRLHGENLVPRCSYHHTVSEHYETLRLFHSDRKHLHMRRTRAIGRQAYRPLAALYLMWRISLQWEALQNPPQPPEPPPQDGEGPGLNDMDVDQHPQPEQGIAPAEGGPAQAGIVGGEEAVGMDVDVVAGPEVVNLNDVAPMMYVGYGNFSWQKPHGSVETKRLTREMAIQGATAMFMSEKGTTTNDAAPYHQYFSFPDAMDNPEFNYDQHNTNVYSFIGARCNHRKKRLRRSGERKARLYCLNALGEPFNVPTSERLKISAICFPRRPQFVSGYTPSPPSPIEN
ncbi:hypothetical protein BC829DRAFT_420594 [Chytridium lagenaria]|nr:hypothetical protein BC829DRAFT_420594 [Chytridium lagenaria]